MNFAKLNTGQNESIATDQSSLSFEQNHNKKKKRSSKLFVNYTFIHFKLLTDKIKTLLLFLLSASPFGKCIRQRWTEEEKNIAYAAFKQHIASKILPSFKEIQELKEANPGIFNRNSAAIKTWINNQIKRQK